jgi:predicted amidohydrolase
MKLTVGVVQSSPAVLDLGAAVERTCAWIARAGREGVRLLAFPETWITGYPVWCDGGSFAHWGEAAAKRVHARLVRESLEVPSAACDRIGAACRSAGVAAVVGAHERVPGGGTLYNALLFFDEHGTLRGRRRKLVPTHGERLVWAAGDAADLDSFSLAGARVGGLICWEHWMPLARHVLHASQEQVHVAAWPHGKERHQIASRHYAFEGRCFVLAAAQLLRRSDFPADFELAADFAGDPEVLLDGGSSIIGPDGEYVVSPRFGEQALLAAELDLDRRLEESFTLDTAGHYARPDLFDLRVRRERPAAWRPME